MSFALNVTPEQLYKLINDAGAVIRESLDKAKNSDTPIILKEELKKNAGLIQRILDAILGGAGVITQDQIDQLDYQIRMQKMTMLQASTEKSKEKYTVIIASVIVGLGLLFYITRKRK